MGDLRVRAECGKGGLGELGARDGWVLGTVIVGGGDDSPSSQLAGDADGPAGVGGRDDFDDELREIGGAELVFGPPGTEVELEELGTGSLDGQGKGIAGEELMVGEG